MLILTVKDLSERERETLTGQGAIIFEKGSGWRPRVRAELRRLACKGKGVRVLVADDNPAALELVREGLSQFVSSIIEASDGREALQKIRESKPDLILLDIQCRNGRISGAA